MIVNDDRLIDELAEDCVEDMGDIFWDYETAPADHGYSDPVKVAMQAVRATIHKFARLHESTTIYPSSLRQEYADLVGRIGYRADGSDIAQALSTDADWTKETATTLVDLARRHGTFVLRSALALAEALGVEDGVDGA